MTGALMSGSRCSWHDLPGDELVVVTPNTPQYSVFLKRASPPEVLLREPFIQREAGSGTRAYERFLAARGINTEQMRVVAELETLSPSSGRLPEGLAFDFIAACDRGILFVLVCCLPGRPTGVIERRLYIGCRKGARAFRLWLRHF